MSEIEQYWENRLKEFDETIYPIFHKHGYGKNTALTVWALDELESSLIIATSARNLEK